MKIRRLNEGYGSLDGLDSRFKPNSDYPTLPDGTPCLEYYAESGDDLMTNTLYLGVGKLDYSNDKVVTLYLDIDVPIGNQHIWHDKFATKDMEFTLEGIEQVVSILNGLVDEVSPDMSDDEFTAVMDKYGFEHWIKDESGKWHYRQLYPQLYKQY